MKKNVQRLLTISILTSMTGAGIFAINKLINASAVIRNALHNKSQYFYDWKFGRIHYTIEGSGSPLLLLHDLSPASSSVEWKFLKKQLAKDHTVYCMDLLGCGCSDRPKITYTNFLYVQLITDFIKAVIKQPTDVLTSGLSGSFAVMACKNDSSIIRRIMMINPEDLAVLNQIPKSIFITHFMWIQNWKISIMSPRTWKMVPESTCSRALPGSIFTVISVTH